MRTHFLLHTAILSYLLVPPKGESKPITVVRSFFSISTKTARQELLKEIEYLGDTNHTRCTAQALFRREP